MEAGCFGQQWRRVQFSERADWNQGCYTVLVAAPKRCCDVVDYTAFDISLFHLPLDQRSSPVLSGETKRLRRGRETYGHSPLTALGAGAQFSDKRRPLPLLIIEWAGSPPRIRFLAALLVTSIPNGEDCLGGELLAGEGGGRRLNTVGCPSGLQSSDGSSGGSGRAGVLSHRCSFAWIRMVTMVFVMSR
jgi:hypothetical protein